MKIFFLKTQTSILLLVLTVLISSCKFSNPDSEPEPIEQPQYIAQGHHSTLSPDEVKSFWTKEKIDANEPMDLPLSSSSTDVKSANLPNYEKANTTKLPADDCGAFHSTEGGCSASAIGLEWY